MWYLCYFQSMLVHVHKCAIVLDHVRFPISMSFHIILIYFCMWLSRLINEINPHELTSDTHSNILLLSWALLIEYDWLKLLNSVTPKNIFEQVHIFCHSLVLKLVYYFDLYWFFISFVTLKHVSLSNYTNCCIHTIFIVFWLLFYCIWYEENCENCRFVLILEIVAVTE